MEDIIDNFIINWGNTDSTEEESSDGDSDTDTENVESFMSDFIPL
jgi:hypothetical protein